MIKPTVEEFWAQVPFGANIHVRIVLRSSHLPFLHEYTEGRKGITWATISRELGELLSDLDEHKKKDHPAQEFAWRAAISGALTKGVYGQAESVSLVCLDREPGGLPWVLDLPNFPYLGEVVKPREEGG